MSRKYYHAKRRSDESPLNYLYRLNVIGLREKIKIKGGLPKVQKDHEIQYIATLRDPALAEQLSLLRSEDVDEIEDVLRSQKKVKARGGKVLFGSSKFRQKVTVPPERPRDLNRRSVQAVRATQDESSSEDSNLDGSSDGEEMRIIYSMEMEVDNE